MPRERADEPWCAWSKQAQRERPRRSRVPQPLLVLSRALCEVLRSCVKSLYLYVFVLFGDPFTVTSDYFCVIVMDPTTRVSLDGPELH